MHSLATLDVPVSLGIQFADGPNSPRGGQRVWGIIICPQKVPCNPDAFFEG
jgi:hypothetical protein